MKNLTLVIIIFFNLNTFAEILIHKPNEIKKIDAAKEKKSIQPKAIKPKLNRNNKPISISEKQVTTKKKTIDRNYISFKKINKARVISENISRFLNAMRIPYKKISLLDPQMSPEYVLDLSLPLILDQIQSYKEELSWNLDVALDYANCQRDCKKILINLTDLDDNKSAVIQLINSVSTYIISANEMYDLRVQTEKIKYLKEEYNWLVGIERDLSKIKNTHVINNCDPTTDICTKFLEISSDTN